MCERNAPQDRELSAGSTAATARCVSVRKSCWASAAYVRLRALGYEPAVWHMNEGHSAFLGLERVRELVAGDGLAFDEAVEVVRSNTLFTTHTPVPAGNDAFSFELIDKFFWQWWGQLGHRPGAVHRFRPPGPGLGSAVQHDRACASIERIPQRRQRTARQGQPADVAVPVAGYARARGADWSHHQRRSHGHMAAERTEALYDAYLRRRAGWTSWRSRRCGGRSRPFRMRNCGKFTGCARRN